MMEQPTSTPRVARDLALAFAAATLLSLVIVALSEAARVPADEGRGGLSRFTTAFVPALDGALAILWKLVVVQGLATGVLALRHAIPARRRPLAGVQIALLAGAVLLCYATLVEYPRFAWYPPLVAFHAAAAGLLAIWAALFPLPDPPAPRSRPASLLGGRVLPAAFGVLFAGIHVLNYALYPERYPTLHTSALMISFLLLQAGASTALFLAARGRRGRRALAGALAALILIAGASVPLSRLAALQASRPGFLRFTVVGQELLRGARDGGGGADGAQGKGVRDPEGVERFGRLSNLPPLPEDFRLLDHNILLISVETFRADESSMNNPRRDLTPALRAYAEDGAHWFTRAYVGGSYTLQSITSLFTMAYPSSTGLELGDPRWSGTLPEDVPTVPDHLEEAGYDTFWVSYAGGGSEDGILGWCWSRFSRVTVHGNDEAVLQEAQKELSRRKDGPRRFFGWVFFPAPHSPYVAHFDDMPARTERDRYRQEIRYVDGVIARLLGHLERTGLDGNTVVIIHGDHGEEFTEHGKHGHEALYRECSNVPLIVKIPGVAGRRSDAPTSLAYLFPWLLATGNDDLAAVARSRMEDVFGPVLEAADGAVVAELFGTFGTRSLLVHGDHHFHHDFASGHNELYDLSRDPGEKRNLFDPGAPLSREFLERFERYVGVRDRNLDIGFSEGTLDRLETREDRQARAAVIEELRQAGEDGIFAALEDGDWHVRREAAVLCGERALLRDGTIDRWIGLLVTDHREVRKRVTRDLKKTTSPAVAARLLHALRADSPLRGRFYVYGDGKVRTMAEAVTAVLDRLGTAALPALVEGLASDDVAVLRYASGAVGRFPSAAGRAGPALRALAGHPDPEVRRNAGESLARLSPADGGP